MQYLIYKHTSPSGKSYIGRTNNLVRRDRIHRTTSGCPAFHSAIQKYGWDNFIHEILCDGLTLEEANECEEFMIKEHRTLAPFGYNLTGGGLNKIPVKEVVEQIKKSKLGFKHSPESINKMKGRKISESAKINRALARAAKPKRKLTEDQKARVSATHKGKKLSPEMIEKRQATRLKNKNTK